MLPSHSAEMDFHSVDCMHILRLPGREPTCARAFLATSIVASAKVAVQSDTLGDVVLVPRPVLHQGTGAVLHMTSTSITRERSAWVENRATILVTASARHVQAFDVSNRASIESLWAIDVSERCQQQRITAMSACEGQTGLLFVAAADHAVHCYQFDRHHAQWLWTRSTLGIPMRVVSTGGYCVAGTLLQTAVLHDESSRDISSVEWPSQPQCKPGRVGRRCWVGCIGETLAPQGDVCWGSLVITVQRVSAAHDPLGHHLVRQRDLVTGTARVLGRAPGIILSIRVSRFGQTPSRLHKSRDRTTVPLGDENTQGSDSEGAGATIRASTARTRQSRAYLCGSSHTRPTQLVAVFESSCSQKKSALCGVAIFDLRRNESTTRVVTFADVRNPIGLCVVGAHAMVVDCGGRTTSTSIDAARGRCLGQVTQSVLRPTRGQVARRQLCAPLKRVLCSSATMSLVSLFIVVVEMLQLLALALPWEVGLRATLAAWLIYPTPCLQRVFLAPQAGGGAMTEHTGAIACESEVYIVAGTAVVAGLCGLLLGPCWKWISRPPAFYSKTQVWRSCSSAANSAVTLSTIGVVPAMCALASVVDCPLATSPAWELALNGVMRGSATRTAACASELEDVWQKAGALPPGVYPLGCLIMLTVLLCVSLRLRSVSNVLASLSPTWALLRCAGDATARVHYTPPTSFPFAPSYSQRTAKVNVQLQHDRDRALQRDVPLLPYKCAGGVHSGLHPTEAAAVAAAPRAPFDVETTSVAFSLKRRVANRKKKARQLALFRLYMGDTPPRLAAQLPPGIRETEVRATGTAPSTVHHLQHAPRPLPRNETPGSWCVCLQRLSSNRSGTRVHRVSKVVFGRRDAKAAMDPLPRTPPHALALADPRSVTMCVHAMLADTLILACHAGLWLPNCVRKWFSFWHATACSRFLWLVVLDQWLRRRFCAHLH